MNSLVTRFSATSREAELKRAYDELEEEGAGASMWGSTAGYAMINKGVPMCKLPNVADVSL